MTCITCSDYKNIPLTLSDQCSRHTLLEVKLDNVVIYKYHILSPEWIYLYDIANGVHGIAANFLNETYNIIEAHISSTAKNICWLHSSSAASVFVYITTNILTIRVSPNTLEIGMSVGTEVKKYNFTNNICELVAEIIEYKFDVLGPFMAAPWGAPNYVIGYNPPPPGSWMGPDNHYHPSYAAAVDDHYATQYTNFRTWITYTMNRDQIADRRAGPGYWTEEGNVTVYPRLPTSGHLFVKSNLGISQFDDRVWFETQTVEYYRGIIPNF